MRNVLKGSALLLALLVGVCGINLLRLPGPAPAGGPPAPVELDGDALAQRLGAALRIPTISYEEGRAPELAAFEAFAAHLASSFPKTHAAMQRENVGPSLLYTWPGRDPAAKPLLLLAHMDVVP
ncbi:MAG: hypothetical protein HYV18_09790, partial [Gammaproteobacteria bacterium]|nr:hypothetical protein [Gammaproteobacteria bacterium]